jgi:hypothetical protein
MDVNSQAFHTLTNQLPGYYTPTPGGTSTLYHHQAGDLHTPGFGMGIGTPLSLPTSEGALNAGHQASAFNAYQHHMQPQLPHQPFQNVNPFHMHHQTSFPPQHFSHQTLFDQHAPPLDASPVDDINMDMHMHHPDESPQMLFHSQALQSTMQTQPSLPMTE